MKKSSTLLLLLASSICFNSSAQTPNPVDQNTFTKIRIESAGIVHIKQDSSISVTVLGGNSSQHLEKRIKNGTLVIDANSATDILVTLPVLERIEINGRASVQGDSPINADHVELLIGGDGKIELDLHADKVNSSISGLGKIILSGVATETDFNISGSGKIDASELSSNKGKADISGLGKIILDVRDELHINISGSGAVLYKNKPKSIDENISGMGKIESMNSDTVRDSRHDTTKVELGKSTELWIIKSNSDKEVQKKKEVHPIWAGVELGLNSWINGDNKFSPPSGWDDLDLKQEKSISFSLNVLQKNIEFGKSNVWFFTGLGLTWNNYRFHNNVLLFATDPITTLKDTISTRNYEKSKLTVSYLTAPLMFEFFTSRKTKNAFHMGAGALLGLRIGSHTKQKYTEDGQTHKPKTYDDFNLNPFQYGLRVAIGFSSLNLFADYNFSTLFKSGKGPTLYPVNAGITLAAF